MVAGLNGPGQIVERRAQVQFFSRRILIEGKPHRRRRLSRGWPGCDRRERGDGEGGNRRRLSHFDGRGGCRGLRRGRWWLQGGQQPGQAEQGQPVEPDHGRLTPLSYPGSGVSTSAGYSSSMARVQSRPLTWTNWLKRAAG